MVLSACPVLSQNNYSYLKDEIEIWVISSFTISAKFFLKEIRTYTMIN